MNRHTHLLASWVILPLALVSCNRSEELGHLPDAGDAAALGDDAHVDACQTGCFSPNGASCTNAGQCASGFCVDGVCCNTACLPSMICFAPGSVGTCTAPTASTPQANGIACKQASECASGFCADGVCCNTACTDSSMTCSAPGSVGTCAAATTSTSTPAANGAACTQSSECTSGFCVDGVCCNTACAGSCVACDATGAVGTCTSTASCP